MKDEYSEVPSVQHARRELQFPFIRWLSKAKFEQLVNSNIELNPYLNADEDLFRRPQNRIYIGKSLQTNNEGVKYHQIELSDNQQQSTNLEIIGSVVRNLVTGLWELHVSHGGVHLVIRQDFLVLSIEDPNSFEWKRTRSGDIPAWHCAAALTVFQMSISI